MGATNFETYRDGADLRQVYTAAVREAQDEYGHDDGYNGTISTTSGVYQTKHSLMTREGALMIANAENLAERTEKWGSACAIPVAADDQFTYRTVKETISLAEGDEDFSGHPEWALKDRAERAAIAKYDTALAKVEVVPNIKTKIVVENPTGKLATKYQVVGTRILADTKAAAVKAAKSEIERGVWGRTSFEIQPVKVDEVGKVAATTVRKVTVSATAKVTITLATPKVHTATTGWVLYGMAAE